MIISNFCKSLLGIQVNKVDKTGLTAIYIAAAETKNMEVVRILAKHGAGQISLHPWLGWNSLSQGLSH